MGRRNHSHTASCNQVRLGGCWVSDLSLLVAVGPGDPEKSGPTFQIQVLRSKAKYTFSGHRTVGHFVMQPRHPLSSRAGGFPVVIMQRKFTDTNFLGGVAI